MISAECHSSEQLLRRVISLYLVVAENGGDTTRFTAQHWLFIAYNEPVSKTLTLDKADVMASDMDDIDLALIKANFLYEFQSTVDCCTKKLYVLVVCIPVLAHGKYKSPERQHDLCRTQHIKESQDDTLNVTDITTISPISG